MTTTTRYSYAIRYGYGAHAINHGNRADYLWRFTTRAGRDAYVRGHDDAEAFTAAGVRDEIRRLPSSIPTDEWEDGYYEWEMGGSDFTPTHICDGSCKVPA